MELTGEGHSINALLISEPIFSILHTFVLCSFYYILSAHCCHSSSKSINLRQAKCYENL